MARQPTSIDRYFKGIAVRAANAVAMQNPPPPKPAPVFDGPQQATAIAWSALAVHPMSVLETEYVGVVREAERRGGNDPDKARENGFRAMTQFFSLTSGSPTLLGGDSVPLIEEQMKDLAARSDLVRAMLADRPADALQELAEVVADAADLVARMTSADDLGFSGAGVRSAAAYLGMFEMPADQAARRWAQQHDDVNNVAAYADEIDAELVTPLCASGNAVASARSLYNITPFYLFRLMHRFIGGDQAAAMDLASKGVASGEATKAMHPRAWRWLTGWHEERVVELKNSLAALDLRLRDEFDVQDDVIRFFLKGGRAMFTALGAPERGENDWDTGILINPHLSPDQWYIAFAKVNDLVVAFLDRSRFSYSALLARHADELDALQLVAQARPAASPETPRYFSQLAMLAEHDAERHDRRQRAAKSHRGTAAVGSGRAPAALAARPRVQPVGVNGELIDVGISKRSSVELLEHWLEVQIDDRQGVTINGVPVPMLPYFIDDFSMIIREALATGTADRKLAKRLVRLKLVLDSNDQTLTNALRGAEVRAKAVMPKAAKALGVGMHSSAGRLAAWALSRLVESIPDLDLMPSYCGALDTMIAADAAKLTNPVTVEPIWRQVQAGIEEVDREACHAILVLQNVASTLSRRVVQDGVTLAQAIGGPGLAQTPLWNPVFQAIASIITLNGHGGTFFLSGGFAARLQASHAGFAPNEFLALCPDGAVEILYRSDHNGPALSLQMLQQRLSGLLQAKELVAKVVEGEAGAAVAVCRRQPLGGMNVPDPTPTLLLVRAEQDGPGQARILDHLQGWPVASARDLVHLFQTRAAHSPDFDLREARRNASVYLLDDVLGRQLG
ncbi:MULTISPECIES: hypothetical protein [unclassified Yoonia]|uniref:hypothetical protein n=1 Tax=unclassified Yoonia TaxID=2629118 RepID=UPI002AFF91D4|nr:MULTISPECIES: hypothetical protein [unclassified Yoonia]